MAHATYLSYTEYKERGGLKDQAAFTLLEFKARKRIDYLTDSRVQGMEIVPEAVKLCIMVLMSMEDSSGAEKQATQPGITSFSTDGYSESYGNTMDADEADKQMSKLVRQYLWGEKDDKGVPLLYRGVRV